MVDPNKPRWFKKCKLCKEHSVLPGEGITDESNICITCRVVICLWFIFITFSSSYGYGGWGHDD